MVALSCAAEPAATPDKAATATPETTVAASTAATTAATTPATAPASKPASMQVASKPTPTVPLSKQTFTVVEAMGLNIALQSTLDVHKPVTLKKGQLLVLKSSSGEEIEVMGPYQGKPIDHYTTISDGGTMGYDAKSFSPKGHCTGSGSPHPSGGPNPDETGGAENQASHC